MACVSAAMLASLTSGLPLIAARAAVAALSAGYSTYEVSHWNMHHRPARTAWGERMRKRHDRHHFGAPSANLGVTTAFWDRMFDTEAPRALAG